MKKGEGNPSPFFCVKPRSLGYTPSMPNNAHVEVSLFRDRYGLDLEGEGALAMDGRLWVPGEGTQPASFSDQNTAVEFALDHHYDVSFHIDLRE